MFLYHVNTFAYFELKNEMTIGRTSGDLVYKDDNRMSGCHAIIRKVMEKGVLNIYIEDLGSKNPTVVNRAQIYPKIKTRVKIYSLLEIGAQHFILSDTKSISLDILNKVLDHNLSKPIVKIEKDQTVSTTSASSALDIIGKEKQLAQALDELKTLEQNAQAELLKLEQEKDKVMAMMRSKKNEMQKKIAEIKEDLQNAHKLKQEVENKKKVINIKGIG